jgi:hypothetical protein
VATVVLGTLGAAVGGYFGGPQGAQIGWAVGTLIGGQIDGAGKEAQSRGRLEDVRVTGSAYGATIVQGWGLNKFGGNIILALAPGGDERRPLPGAKFGQPTRRSDLPLRLLRGRVVSRADYPYKADLG